MDGGERNNFKCREKRVSSCRLTEENTGSCEEVPAVPAILTRQKLELLRALALRCKKQHKLQSLRELRLLVLTSLHKSIFKVRKARTGPVKVNTEQQVTQIERTLQLHKATQNMISAQSTSKNAEN